MIFVVVAIKYLNLFFNFFLKFQYISYVMNIFYDYETSFLFQLLCMKSGVFIIQYLSYFSVICTFFWVNFYLISYNYFECKSIFRYFTNLFINGWISKTSEMKNGGGLSFISDYF